MKATIDVRLPIDKTKLTARQQNLVKIAESLTQFAKNIIEGGEELAPIIHGHSYKEGPDGKREFIFSVAPLFVYSLNQEVRAEVIRKTLHDFGCYAYVMASEAWAPPKGEGPKTREDLKDYRWGDLSKRPDRVSCLALNGENRWGDQLGIVMPIDETGGRKIIFTDPVIATVRNREDSGDFALDGRNYGMLD